MLLQRGCRACGPLAKSLRMSSPLFSSARACAAVPAAVKSAPPAEVFGTADGAPRSLAELNASAGLLPRPDFIDEKLKPGFRGGKALFIFFLCNALPFGYLLHYLREQRSQKTSLALISLPSNGEDVAAEALRTIRTSATCFLMYGENGSVLHVDPHPPEGTAYVPPTEPLPLVPNLERSDLTDLFESPTQPGLGFVHVAISRASAAATKILAGDRSANLLYVSPTRGAYCTISGQVSVLSDVESRRRYWKPQWVSSFPNTTPFSQEAGGSTADPSGSAEASAPAAWSNEDYLLLRFAVSDVNVRAMVNGPQRWRDVKARTTDNGWALVPSENA